jgi:S1-C subfamily serine protease
MAAGRVRDRPVLAVLAFFRPRRVLTQLAGAGALALVPGAGSVQEVPGARAQIALSFAPVVRETPPYEPPPEVSLLERRHALAGATVANLSPGLNRDLGLDLFEAGVIVLEVDRATPAARLGLRRGDLIRTVADAPIDELAEVQDILQEHPLPWRLEIERAGRRLAVVIGG